MKKKILIFYQSITEITEILPLVKRYPFKSCVIIITGHKNFIFILQKLKLDEKYGVKIFQFNCLSMKNPINLIKMYFQINFSEEAKKILKFEFKSAFFFNKCIDFIAPLFLSRCNIEKIKFIDIYKLKFRKIKNKISLKNIIQKIILKFLYNRTIVKIEFLKLLGPHPFITYIFKINKSIIKINKIRRKQNKYLFSLNLHKVKNNIIYLDANDDEYLKLNGEITEGNKYSRLIYNILKNFENRGFNVIIKKHPREKLTSSISLINRWTYILDPIPIELYKLSNVKFIITLSSFGCVALPKNIKVICLVRLLDSKTYTYNNIYKFFSRFNKKIIYPKNIKILKKIICKK